MATTKTLTPTNQTITIDAFQGEKPDHRHVADAETKLADAVNALNSNLGGLHIVQLTKTVNSGYFAIASSEIPIGKKLIIQNCYVTNSNYSDLTFAVQANASGSANAYYVYVRKDSSNPPENTSVTVNILYMD